MTNFLKKWVSKTRYHKTFAIAAPLAVGQLYLMAFLITRTPNWFLIGSIFVLALGWMVSAGIAAHAAVTITGRRSWGPFDE